MMLALQVPTDGFLPVPGEVPDAAPLTIGVSCLISYERTGSVRLACERGCDCQPRRAHACLCPLVFSYLFLLCIRHADTSS